MLSDNQKNMIIYFIEDYRDPTRYVEWDEAMETLAWAEMPELMRAWSKYKEAENHLDLILSKVERF